jgi:hypothetical protein
MGWKGMTRKVVISAGTWATSREIANSGRRPRASYSMAKANEEAEEEEVDKDADADAAAADEDSAAADEDNAVADEVDSTTLAQAAATAVKEREQVTMARRTFEME